MPAHLPERVEDLARVRELAPEHRGRDEVRDDVPRRPGRLRTVEGMRVGDAFAPAAGAVAVGDDQDELPIVDAAEARLEEADERQAQQPQLEAFDSHRPMLPANPGAVRLVYCAMTVGSTLDFRYIAIEGPAGVGKSSLAERLGSRLDAAVVLDDAENPFLTDFYAERPGAAFQAQLFFTLSRHRQQTTLRQSDLFSQITVCDYLFARDKVYAYLNLDDNELFIYQRLYDLLAADIGIPDLVIFLQTPTDVLRRRVRDRERAEPHRLRLGYEYLREPNEAYVHFSLHDTAPPRLVIETSQVDQS